MKLLLSLGLLLTVPIVTEAQQKKIDKKFDAKVAVEDLTYLTSDKLKGRDPARAEIALAYEYIAEQLEAAGAKLLPGAEGFFQNIPFRLSAPPSKGVY